MVFIKVGHVVSQQAATPTLTFSSTEARADAEPSVSANADQLNSIPRHLQRHSKSLTSVAELLLTQPAVNPVPRISLSHLKRTNYFSNRTCCLFRGVLPQSSPSSYQSSSSSPVSCLQPLTCFHGSSPSVFHGVHERLPRSHGSPCASSTVFAFLVRSSRKFPRTLRRCNPAFSTVPFHSKTYPCVPSLPASDVIPPEEFPSPTPCVIRCSSKNY